MQFKMFFREVRGEKFFASPSNLGPFTSILFLSSICRFEKSKIILIISLNFKLLFVVSVKLMKTPKQPPVVLEQLCIITGFVSMSP